MKNKERKICYLSGTRADYGLMRFLLKEIQGSDTLELVLCATGMHLMPQFGNTLDEIKNDFSHVIPIESIVKRDDKAGMATFNADLLGDLTKVLIRLKPDITLTLGDRAEMLMMAVASVYLGIPTAHLHGGEVTSTVDEIVRHAITKLSHIHFPATKDAAERIRNMGEDISRITIVGAPALDIILSAKLPTGDEIREKVGLNKNKDFILLTQHPEYKEDEAVFQIRETLKAVKKVGLPVVVVYPNSDAGGRRIIKEIEKEQNNPLFRIFKSLRHTDFLSLEREAAVWVGNSSGAMIESSSFKTPVVNIGSRQSKRLRGDNVIDVGYSATAIELAIRKSLSKEYVATLEKIKNPWGDGQSAKRVVEVLERIIIDDQLLHKQIAY